MNVSLRNRRRPSRQKKPEKKGRGGERKERPLSEGPTHPSGDQTIKIPRSGSVEFVFDAYMRTRSEREKHGKGGWLDGEPASWSSPPSK